jgi:hypothetical protein
LSNFANLLAKKLSKIVKAPPIKILEPSPSIEYTSLAILNSLQQPILLSTILINFEGLIFMSPTSLAYPFPIFESNVVCSIKVLSVVQNLMLLL